MGRCEKGAENGSTGDMRMFHSFKKEKYEFVTIKRRKMTVCAGSVGSPQNISKNEDQF